MPINRKEFIAGQAVFYRNGYRRLATLGVVLSIIMILLIAIILYQYFNRPPIKYFATTSDGRLIEIFPAS